MENQTDKSEATPATQNPKPYRVYLRYLVEVHVEATDEAEAIMKAHDEANHGDWETLDEQVDCLDDTTDEVLDDDDDRQDACKA